MVSSKEAGISLSFLGGCGEVGRIGIKLKVGERTLLLDYGVSLEEGAPKFPAHVRPRELLGAVLSHAHLDHSGALPLLYSSGFRIPVYTTSLTARLSLLLLEDFLKVSGYYLPFEDREIKCFFSSVSPLRYEQQLELPGEIVIELIEAGHIPGSAMTLIKTPELNILYTGDFNLVETQLLRAAALDSINFANVDVVIMEATYADVEHPERRSLEKEFVEECTEVIESGGVVLVPAFAVGRSQEILCVLRRYDFGYRVTIDGMARQASKIILRHPNFVKDYELFRNALMRARWINSWLERRKAASTPGVIITPAGMLKGGAALYYLQRIYKDPKNAIFLVSYQIEGTPGRVLLDTGKFPFGDVLEEVKARVKWFDFSAHCGRRELLEFIKRLSSGTRLFMIHGEQEGIAKLALEVSENYDLEVIIPKEGEEYVLS